MIEYRRLLVSEQEFKDVLRHHIALEEGDGAPNVKALWDVDIVQDDPIAVHVHYQTGDGRQVSRTLDAYGITAAFVGLCLTSCIPISKVSVKTVKQTVGGIAMDMTIKDLPVLLPSKGAKGAGAQQTAR